MESIQTEASVLSRHTRPATIRDAIENASQLTLEDCRELRDAGWDPYLALIYSVASSHMPIAYIDRKGAVGGLAGVTPEDGGIGRIWLLCTDAVKDNPATFYRTARAWVKSLGSYYTLLHNVADPRNKMHLKLLHNLGFKRLSYVEVGQKKHTYVEFAKLCAPPLQSASQVP
jgi:hypothetical protein